MTEATNYPGVDETAPLETLPAPVLVDMLHRACDTLLNTRQCFDAVHMAATLALNAMNNGDSETARAYLEAIGPHPKDKGHTIQ